MSAARHGDISRAAKELQTAQLAVGRYIARLEKHLSAQFSERTRTGTRTGVNLTEAGHRYREAVLSGPSALHEGVLRSRPSRALARRR